MTEDTIVEENKEQRTEPPTVAIAPPLVTVHGISVETLLPLLIADRNHHFQHASEVSSKVAFSVSSTTLALLAAAVFSDSKLHLAFVDPRFLVGIAALILGLAIGLWGLQEHFDFHRTQWRRLEDAVERLVYGGESPERVLAETWHATLGGKPIPLLVAEPDRRGFGYHDTKFAIGLVFQIVAVILVALALFNGEAA